MTKAYSYIRFSSSEQAKGRSQARQLEECEKYCAMHGLELAREEEYTFLDRGRSAYKAEHVGEKGQLFRFLRRVNDGSIPAGSVLIVESLDRLSREHVKHALPRFIDLLNQGISIVTLTDGRRYTSDFTEMDLIMSIFVMSRAHEESSTKAKRLGDAWRKKQDDARAYRKPISKAVPMWLAVTSEGFQTIEERAAVVRRIFQMAIDGYGKAVTAIALNDDGIPAFKSDPSKKVIAWGPSSVGKVLTNKAVIGVYQPYSVQDEGKRQPRGEPIVDYYPRVIDEATFYEAQAAISGRKVAKATKQSKNFNVWQGLAICGDCLSAMHLIKKGPPPKGGTYLHCYHARKGLCKAKAVRLDYSERVFKQLLTRVNSLALVQDSSGKINRQLSQVEARLSEQYADLNNHKAALKARTSSPTIYDFIVECEQEIGKLTKERDDLQTALASERITSKENFLADVDMQSYEGRARANLLLKRLKVKVCVNVVASDRAKYVVFQGDGPPIVGFNCLKDEVNIVPFNDDQVERMNRLDFDGSLESSLLLLHTELSIRSGKWTEEEIDAKVDEAYVRAGIS